MKIETYEIEPSNSEIATLAQDSEHRSLAEKLGLTGQLSLSNNESQTVFPYRRMTMVEQRVFEIHCPHKTILRDYKSDQIPVRVLQVASHAIDTEFLHKILVWHPKEARLDPVLVGYTKEWGGDLYLLARWGEVWKEFDVLLAEAKEIWSKARAAKLSKALKTLEALAQSASEDAELFFQGEEVETATYFA